MTFTRWGDRLLTPEVDTLRAVSKDDARRALLATMLRAWGRAVIAIVCSAALLGALGLSEVSGYATITGIYMALSPPAGRAQRVLTVVVATLVIAVMSVIGAELTRWTAAVAISLALAGFVAGLLPRLGSLAAAMQLPLLMSFAYSVGQPLSDAGALDRGLAVLLAMPIYRGRRRAGVPGRPAATARARRRAGARVPGRSARTRRGRHARAETEAALAQFRAAMTRLRDSALPLGGSRGDRAGLALVGAVQEAIVAAELLDDTRAARGGGMSCAAGWRARQRQRRRWRRRRGERSARAARRRRRPLTARRRPRPRSRRSGRRRAAGDHAVWLLADALADAAAAAAVLTGRPGASLPATAVGELASPARRLLATLDVQDPTFRRAVRLGVAAGLAGLAAPLLDLGRAYWPVFSVIVIFNAPAAQDWRRALERLGGTMLGFFVALPLIELAGTSQPFAMGLALAMLLPGLVLMPINYGAAMVFITATVGLMFAAGGTVDDFLSFRVEDTLLGAAIAAGHRPAVVAHQAP